MHLFERRGTICERNVIMKKNNNGFRAIVLIIVALIVVCAFVMTPPEGLTVEAFRCLLFVLSAFILFVTGALPVVMTCLLLVTGFYWGGVMTTKALFAASGGNAVFFLLAGYGIGEALVQTNVAGMLVRAIVGWAGRSASKIISGFVILSAFISLFVSNATAAIIVTGLVVSVMHAVGNPAPGSSKLLKGLMMAPPMGAMCGGLASPASNSLNVTLQGLMTTATGVEIGFLDWCKIGVPMTLVMTIAAAILIPKMVGAADLTDEEIAAINKTCESVPEKMNKKDKIFVIVMVVMIVLWVSSNWIKKIHVTFTAMLGLAIFFFPGVDILDGKKYMKSIKPLGVVLLLAIMPLAEAMKVTGAGEWLVNILFGGAGNLPKAVVYVMITLVALVIHLAVPSGSGNAALSATLMFPVAATLGLSVPAVLLILASQCGNNFLLPTEAIYSYTYCYDHFDFKDNIKTGLPLTIISVVMCSFIVPALAGIFGM